ncbi:diguanylate cyclase [Pseudoalteromonas fenneropenaei]|uniref:diguanylate cyclase n=1 Tax=Pseudoalteromonas fenneropenaei TaxID=1737459 RepID=A0ABV7CN01_9GAMM
MEKRMYALIVAIVLFTLGVNSLVFYWSSQVSRGIETLDNAWRSDTSYALHKAKWLAELERHFGYGGFIHHFKNYILRRDDRYYQAALNDIQQLNVAFNAFSQLTQTDLEREALLALHQTLMLYTDNLLLARSETNNMLSTNDLDKLVKVDDAPAEHALQMLRQQLELAFVQAQQDQVGIMQRVTSRSELGAWLVVPLLWVAAGLNLIAFWQVFRLLGERQMLFDAAPDALFYSNQKGKICEVNHIAAKMFGYTRHELLSMTVEDLIPARFRADHVHKRRTFSGKTNLRRTTGSGLRMIILHRNGEEIPVDIAISSVELGHQTYNVAIVRDIRAEQALQQKAERDHLTQVFNRRHLDDLLLEELQRANRYHRRLGVLIIDLDHFKALNDKQGHLQGDLALQHVSEFLINSKRPSDVVGRWGGDEFMLVCPETGRQAALSFALRLVEDYERSNDWKLTLSIGVTAYDLVTDKLTPQICVQDADKALYQAKANGRNQAVLYHPDMQHFIGE